MSDGIQRPMYWACVLAGAFFLLAAANAAASSGLLERLNGTAKMRSPYSATVSQTGRAVVKTTAVKPGETGRGRVTVTNTGTRPIRKVLLTQDKVSTGGAGAALHLQVFDTTTKKCLYPRPTLKKPRPGTPAPKEPRACGSWRPFTAGKALNKLQVPPRKGAAWARKERHVIEVRWRLDPSSPNTDQGRKATFRLLWRMSA